jgi:hypothetical protein
MNLMVNGIEVMKESPGELPVQSRRRENGELLVSVLRGVSKSHLGQCLIEPWPGARQTALLDSFLSRSARTPGQGHRLSLGDRPFFSLARGPHAG